jgi:hypothetical protein
MKPLLSKNMLTSANRTQELNCTFCFVIYLCRANDKKEDLRRHHFEFGGMSSPMTTTQKLDYGPKDTSPERAAFGKHDF